MKSGKVFIGILVSFLGFALFASFGHSLGIADINPASSKVTGGSSLPEDSAGSGTIRLGYRFEEPVLQQSGRYHRVEVPGLRVTREPGEPQIPIQTARILLPHGTTYGDVKVSYSRMEPIAGEYLIEPAQEFYMRNREGESVPDPDIYSSSSPYPENHYEVVTVQVKRGYRILYVNIYPVRYSPSAGKLEWTELAEVEVTTKPLEKAGYYRGLPKDRELLARSIDNPEELESYPLKGGQVLSDGGNLKGQRSEPSWPPQVEAEPVEYVIITNEALKNAPGPYNFQALKAHREQNGLTAAIVTIEQITSHYPGDRPDGGEDDQTRIRNFIIDIAGNEETVGKWQTDYVLLGGNVDIIPARKFIVPGQGELPADMYYGCLDGTFDFNENGIYGEPDDGPGGGEVDLLYEVAVGRFSIADQSELSNVVRKTIAYENSTHNYLHKVSFSAQTMDGFADWMETLKWGTSYSNGFHKNPFFNIYSSFYHNDDPQRTYGYHMINMINSDDTHIFTNTSHGNRVFGLRMYTTAFGCENTPNLGDLNNTRPFFIFFNDCMVGEFSLQPHSVNNYCFAEEIVNIYYGAYAAVACAGYAPGFYREFWDTVIRRNVLELGWTVANSKEQTIGDVPFYRGTYYYQNLFGDPAAKFKMNRIPYVMNTGDYNGDGTSDIGIFRNRTGLWAIRGLTRVYFGGEKDIPVNADYSGNGTAEIAIFRKTTGLWAIRNLTRVYYGGEQDMPIPADYNGNGTTDIAVYRPSTSRWAIRNMTQFYYGNHMDIPTVFDYNGDGTADVAVYRPSAGRWFIRNQGSHYFGRESDLPVPGDYNGDGTDSIAIFRPGTGLWAVQGLTRVYYGTIVDQPVPADYNGNGLEDVSIFRPSTGLWAVRGISRVYYGSYVDFPVSGSSR